MTLPKTMCPGMVNSPETTITNNISESDTIIYVLDPARVPEPPNLMTLGTGTNAETVLVTEINDNAITVERGFQGVAKAWLAGTVIARNFTEYDYQAIKENIEDLDASKETPAGAQAKANAALAAANAYTDQEVGEVAADLAAHLADYIRQPGYGTTGGTSTAFTLTLDPVLSAYTAGTGIVIKLHTDCGDNPTINVNAKGAKALKKHDGTAYSAGELASGGIYMFRYDGTSFINVIPEVPEGAKNNYTAITNPTPNDDSGDGYSVGSIWINTTADLAFICLDATAEAAVWSVFAKSSEGYYYDDGVEYVSWVDGLKEGTFVLSKESDHLYASCTGGGPGGAKALHVTDVMVDLTNINTLKVKLNAVGQGGSDNTAKYVIVYISKVKGDASYDARLLSAVPGARTEAIDVSGLSGNYYIKVGSLHASNASGTSSAEFYEIWGE